MTIDWNQLASGHDSAADMIKEIYQATGNLEETAAKIGVDRKTLTTKMNELGIKRPHRRSKFRSVIIGLLGRMKANEIAHEVGCSAHLVRYYRRLEE